MTHYNYALKRTIRFIHNEYCEECREEIDPEDDKIRFDKTIEHFEKIDDMKGFIRNNKQFINPDLSLKVTYPDYNLEFEDYEGYEYEACESRHNEYARCQREGYSGYTYGDKDHKFETIKIEIVKDHAQDFIALFE